MAKKTTLAEAKAKSGNTGLRVKIDLGADAQALFNERPERRVSFGMLVKLAARHAASGEWKGNVDDGKFVINITPTRMRGLLAEGEEMIKSRPVDVSTAGRAVARARNSLEFLASRNHFADFGEAEALLEQASCLLKEMVFEAGGKPVGDYREVVALADKAETAAKAAVVANLKGYALQLSDRADGQLDDELAKLKKAVDSTADLDEQRRLLVKFTAAARQYVRAFSRRPRRRDAGVTEPIGSAARRRPKGPIPPRHPRRRPPRKGGAVRNLDRDPVEVFED